MGFPGETKIDRHARLFKRELKEWLHDKTGPTPAIILDTLRTKWNMWNERGSKVLEEVGWRRVLKEDAWFLEPIPSESAIQIQPKPPTVVYTPEVPRAQPSGPKRDSDNKPYGWDEDA